MMIRGLVSTVIPTFNRLELLPRAIDSALAQSYPRQEVIVIDDGSTDGTSRMVAERYGDRVHCVAQDNGGVSSARNHGMRLARGEFIALLDSDDVWLPGKLQKQVEYLQSRPEFGMVLCDVQRVDRNGRPLDVLRRRDALPRDGDVLLDILSQPSLVPASVLMRSDVFRIVGGFDESLRTAEDIEFHLRVAARFKIGSIDEPLVLAMRGHDGLSDGCGTQQDYVGVMERFIDSHSERIPAPVARNALFRTYVRNARSNVVSGYYSAGLALARKALARTTEVKEFTQVIGLLPLAARVGAARLLRAWYGRKA